LIGFFFATAAFFSVSRAKRIWLAWVLAGAFVVVSILATVAYLRVLHSPAFPDALLDSSGRAWKAMLKHEQKNERIAPNKISPLPSPTNAGLEQSPSEQLRLVLADLQASGHNGAAAVVTESKTRNWVQFFLISKRVIRFDFPNHNIQPPNFSLKGPWERIPRIPDLPYPVTQSQFSDSQIESLKKYFEADGIACIHHMQAVFDDRRKPLAASESVQFDLPLTGNDDSGFIIAVFQVVYGHRPPAVEIERLQIDLD